jgi:hypothetical protein
MSRSARQLIAEIVLPLFVVCAVEVSFERYVARTPDWPMPRLMSSPIDSAKYLAFRSTDSEPLDVLFFGLSPMMRVSGSHLREFSEEKWGIRATSFNFAAPFHSVELDRQMLEDIVLPARRPSVVVYGLGPINLLSEPSPRAIDTMVQAMPVFGLEGETPAAAVQDLLFMHVELLQYREIIRDVLPPPTERPRDLWNTRVKTMDAFGDVKLLTITKPVRGVSMWEQKYVKRFADFETLMKNTRVFNHLGRFAKDCRQHGIELVVLNTPVHPFFLEMLPAGRENYDAFLDRLRATAEANRIRFFDPAPGGIGNAAYFQDTHHHNEAGMIWLTEEIAKYLVAEGLLGQ